MLCSSDHNYACIKSHCRGFKCSRISAAISKLWLAALLITQEFADEIGADAYTADAASAAQKAKELVA